MTRLTAPNHLVSLPRTAASALRNERTAWIEARRAEGATYDQIGDALDIGPDHARAINLTSSADLLERCEGYAERLLEGPLCRRNWPASTRDAVAAQLVRIIKAEGARA